MIPRRLTSELISTLEQFPAVALLGPRQVGKTTLARTLSWNKPIHYLDLESPADRSKLEDPLSYLARFSDHLVIMDEVQRAPEIFQVLRGIIDDRILSGKSVGHFLLLGSASIDLLHQSSETLAGRIAYMELCPLDLLEISSDQEDALWIRGGFPRSILPESDRASFSWREQFITTYLERDIPQLGPRIPSETLRRFWTMLAHHHACLLNAADIARSLAIDAKTVAKYLDLMVDLLLIRKLPPYHANVKKRLVKSPKTYVRDSGLLHTLLRLENMEHVLGHPIAGKSFEGYAIETLLRAAPKSHQASFYLTSTQIEMDLVLELPGNIRWAIEIKRSIQASIEKSFYTAIDDIQPDQSFIIYSGKERYPKAQGIDVISLRELASELNLKRHPNIE